MQPAIDFVRDILGDTGGAIFLFLKSQTNGLVRAQRVRYWGMKSDFSLRETTKAKTRSIACSVAVLLVAAPLLTATPVRPF
jgi:hypothetical protein